jgi:hypothetical protein
VYHGGDISLEFLGDTGGSVQISQSQSVEVGDGILVHLTVPESSGNAGGSGQNCGSQGDETFHESFGDAGGSDQLDAGGSDEILYCEVNANESPKLPLKESGDKKINALQSDDEDSCFSARSAESSEECKFTGDDDVAKGKKKQKLYSRSSLRRRKVPLQTLTREVGEKSDRQVLYHCGFTMLMWHKNSNMHPNPIPSIKEILLNHKMRSVPANARINVMVENRSISTRTKASTLPTVNLEGIVGEDELSCQSAYEVGMKEIQLHYEGLFGNEKLIQDGQLLCIYTKLLKALNEIRLQIATNYQPVMKFKGKSFNTFIAQAKAKEFVTDIDDVEFEDWCVTNKHAHFWYCANVLKSSIVENCH